MRRFLYCYTKLLGIIKFIAYKLVFGSDLKFKGLPHNSHKAQLRIRRGGKVVLCKRSHLAEGNYLWVTDGAEFYLGSNSGFGVNCVISCREKVIIGDNVMAGPFVTIYDNDHIITSEGLMTQSGYKTSPIVIKDNVWIGGHVKILRGVTIGEGSVIAAGSVVNKDVPPYSVFYNRKVDIIKSIG